MCAFADSGRPERFVLCGADVTEGAVEAFDVVEAVDVIGSFDLHDPADMVGGVPITASGSYSSA